MIANGAYLAYYEKQPDKFKKECIVPNGIFFIHQVKDITVVRPNRFSFVYHDRLFEFETGKPIETQTWVLCLRFLKEHSKDCVTWKKRKPKKYFTNYN